MKVVAPQQLSQSQDSDAPIIREISGLEPDADREHDTADAEPDDEGDPNEDLEHAEVASGLVWAPDWPPSDLPPDGSAGPVVRRIHSTPKLPVIAAAD